MQNSDIISMVSLSISLVASLYAYFSNTKKYELKYQYRCEVLKWYAEVIEILINLRHESEKESKDLNPKKQMLVELSAKIEVGRFYFPNVDKGNGFGADKPIAYQGYRNLMLDFLVYSYRLYQRENPGKYLKHAEILERHFTSLLFEILNPKEFLKETEKVTNKIFTKELHFEHFLNENPEVIRDYI